MKPSRSYPIPAILFVFLLAAGFGCKSGPRGAEGQRPGTVVEAVFLKSDHRADDCLKNWASSHLETPDGVLFFDRTSKLRVNPPRKSGSVAYHLHLFHRVAGELLDYPLPQGQDGRIEVSLSRFDHPEHLIVTSAALRLSRDEAHDREDPERKPRPEEAIAPPYIMSFKLLESGLAEPVLALQPFRYDVRTEQGTLNLLVSSFNRRDQLITWVDRTRRLSGLIDEDPYIHLPAYDGAIPPRLTVEVLSQGGKPWQRAGTWHIPEVVDLPRKPGEKPFVFRTSTRDLIAFDPPPRVELELPKDPPETSASVMARFLGVPDLQLLKFVLSTSYPVGQSGEVAIRIASHTVTKETKPGPYRVSLEHLDPSSFPLTTAIGHRLVTPWRLSGGRFSPAPPLGTSFVALGKGEQAAAPRIPARILGPRHATHFDFLSFYGSGGHKKKRSTLLDGYFGNPGDPNITPPFPPPGGGGPPPRPPVGGGDGGAGDRNPAGLSGSGTALQDRGKETCGCGDKGRNCPNTAAPCKGQCGNGCPQNGHCKTSKSGTIRVILPCPPKGKSCGKSEKDCKCPPHSWNFMEVLGALQAWFMPQGAADVDWDGIHSATGNCHEWSKVADAIVWQWVGVQQVGKKFKVYVKFAPCVGVGGNPKGEKPEGNKGDYNGPAGDKPGSGNDSALALAVNPSDESPLTGATFTLDLSESDTQASIEPHSFTDASLILDAELGARRFGGFDVRNFLQWQSTNFVPSGVLNLNQDCLAAIISLLRAEHLAFGRAYWSRTGAPGSLSPVGWNPNLTNLWGTYLSAPSVSSPPTGPGPGPGPTGPGPT